MSKPKNVLGEPLQACSIYPMTGYTRSGACETSEMDTGTHVICARMTEQFLTFTRDRGNDLITPNPDYDFPGLKPGDFWCLCALRWNEAYVAGVAPPVSLNSTHERALEFVRIEALRSHAIEPGSSAKQSPLDN